MVSMNYLDNKKREQIVAALVEGNSIRAITRMTGVSKNTIAKLLVDLGTACAEYQDKVFRNLNCKRVQCDEIWSFVGAKAKNTTPEMKAAIHAQGAEPESMSPAQFSTLLKADYAKWKGIVEASGAKIE